MGSAPAIELERVLSIGADDEADDVLFGSIIGLVAVAGDGTILVGDRQDPKIYVFAPDGQLVATIGSEGEGPGEFTRLSAIHVGASDTLYAFDVRQNRITAFEPASFEYAYDVTVAEDSAGNSPLAFTGVLDSGFVVAYDETYDETVVQGNGFGSERFMYARFVARSGAARGKPLARLPSTEWLGILSGNTLSFSRRPFSGDPIFRMGPGGTLYSGSTRGRNIAINGAQRATATHAIEAIPVRQHELDEILEGRSPDMANRVRRADHYRTRPFYSTFRVDDTGRLWIRPTPADPDAEAARWLILNAESRIVGQAELPSDVYLQVVSRDKAYAVDRTDGVSLAIYEIRN